MLHSILRTAIFLACCAIVAPVQAEIIYGLKSASDNGPSTLAPAYLFNFSDTGGVTPTMIGAMTVDSVGIDADGLALSATYGLRGFMVGGTFAAPTSTLIGINATTAVANLLGTTYTSRSLRGAMFDRYNRLWAVDSVGNKLLRIDPLDGTIISEVALTSGGNAMNFFPATDLAEMADGTTYLSVYDASAGPSLYTLDLSTGVATLAFVDTASDNDTLNTLLLYNSGLAAGSADTAGVLFALDGDGYDDIFTYALPGFGRTEVASNILNPYNNFNAGGLDLASLPNAVVPEPATLGVLALGFSGLLGVRRRRTIPIAPGPRARNPSDSGSVTE